MKNIYQKISDVMADVSYLMKDDSVETGGGKSYRAITEEKVTSTVRASLIKHGITIVPIEQHHERVDERVTAYDKYAKKDVEKINRITTVHVTYRIQNVEDLSDYVCVQSTGTGVDTQDKGVGKAMTYAYKYMLLRTFAIPTGEDPDKISSDLYTDALTGKNDRPVDREGVKKSAPKQATDDEFSAMVNDAPDRAVHDEIIELCSPEQIEALVKQYKVKTLYDIPTAKANNILKQLRERNARWKS